MNKASFTTLTAAILLALGTGACADNDLDDDQATAQTAVTTPPSPTSSTADGNTAQSTTEGATASSFESGTTAGTAGTAATIGTTIAPTARPTFESLDHDRDGFIARTEVPADHPLLVTWAEYDADNDARIARSDFDRYLIAVHPNFADLDKDVDGTLTRAELPSAHALYTGFSTYDTDGDSKLSRAEFDAYGTGTSSPVASTTDTGVDETDTDETD